MKNGFFLYLCLLFSGLGFAQNNYIVKTEDGRRVLLKADYTWEYIDAAPNKTMTEVPQISHSKTDKACQLTPDFVEPKLDQKIQNQLKKGRATLDHIKQKVAKDYECSVEDVLLLRVSEQKSKGSYDFCANGRKVSYKRVGNAIIEKGKLF
ncbi:DUF3157 family protein [Aestuariivivens sediminis]|uniref:DUF3157 family protein n=1 Tax=Aestuariivivens sediminis TaxID=2913557 RepID=UPI001F56F229|nr:DUF3157 family protein [Aestuariivivens sediminis]